MVFLSNQFHLISHPKVSIGYMATATLNELLRTTLTEVERSTKLHDDDPAIVELKNSLVRSVAELAVKREEVPQGDDTPVINPNTASGNFSTRMQSVLHESLYESWVHSARNIPGQPTQCAQGPDPAFPPEK